MKGKLIVIIVIGTIALAVIVFYLLSKRNLSCPVGTTPVPTADGERKCLPDLPPGMEY